MNSIIDTTIELHRLRHKEASALKIIGIDGLTVNELNDELERGGKFVIYQFCISILVMTFKRSSNVYFIRSGENPFFKGLPFSLISLVIGWWGIPWGPIYTIQTVFKNCMGGKDVTQDIIQVMNQSSQQSENVG